MGQPAEGNQASTRTNGRIIPAKLAQGRADDHRTHKGLFLPPSHIAPGQQVLPGFQAETLWPAPPLELYEMGGGQHEGGRAVPLSQRMFVEALSWPYPSTIAPRGSR